MFSFHYSDNNSMIPWVNFYNCLCYGSFSPKMNNIFILLFSGKEKTSDPKRYSSGSSSKENSGTNKKSNKEKNDKKRKSAAVSSKLISGTK